jgi:REP element-mobilizing transposase RayT
MTGLCRNGYATTLPLFRRSPHCASRHAGYIGEYSWLITDESFVGGGAFFFTVALEDRNSDVLITHIVTLRAAFRTARAERKFEIDAIVILPDHLHAILTLPKGDADFPRRWRRIKAAFTHGVRRDGIDLPRRDGAGFVLWQRRFWEHTIRDDADLAIMSPPCNLAPGIPHYASLHAGYGTCHRRSFLVLFFKKVPHRPAADPLE